MMLKLFNKWKRDESPMRKVDKDLLLSIKSKVDDFLTVGDEIDAVETEDIPARKRLRLQLCLFCIYLCAASNKPMTKTDAGIISYILSKEYDLDLLNTYAKIFDIDERNFGCAIPEAVEMLILEGREERETREKHEEHIAEWCNQFINVHRMLSVEYIAISERTAEDQSPGEQYVKMLERYVEAATQTRFA